ncbi:predicted protein [Coccidioides posadasii str. Silveira]|uniref:Predicted protein n=2 Tax=Coccidioides posadasii TaxID=199306 RepID=E9D3Z7_COCPS|nr:predicted protein [Coccidioides posadasii str. Silveira]KMM72430.1 hypothetical protein CPAG_08724 [Coccidioides posadasii RMSCC 3488]
MRFLPYPFLHPAPFRPPETRTSHNLAPEMVSSTRRPARSGNTYSAAEPNIPELRSALDPSMRLKFLIVESESMWSPGARLITKVLYEVFVTTLLSPCLYQKCSMPRGHFRCLVLLQRVQSTPQDWIESPAAS